MYERPTRAEPAAPQRAAEAPLWHRAVAFTMKAALALVLIAGGLWLARDIYTQAPVAERRGEERLARLVDVAPARAAGRGPLIRAFGTVEARRRLAVRPEVGGRVVSVHPGLAPGGLIGEGETVLRLDDRDARADIAAAEAEIARIDAQIRREEGQQARARSDLERSPLRDLTEEQRALILREPQMQELEAQRAAALARRDMAEAALTRTVIRAPYDAIVESEDVAVGTVLTAGTEAAQLVGTDAFRVRLAVAPAALARLGEAEGRAVELTQPGVWAPGETRTGRIEGASVSLMGEGRMAEILVSVADPLARSAATGGPRLLLGAYLEARMEAPAIEGAVAIDRAWLRDGDTLWVMNDSGELEIRDLEIAWRGGSEVLATSGIRPGERIVTTDIATVAEGMALRTRGEGA